MRRLKHQSVRGSNLLITLSPVSYPDQGTFLLPSHLHFAPFSMFINVAYAESSEQQCSLVVLLSQFKTTIHFEQLHLIHYLLIKTIEMSFFQPLSGYPSHLPPSTSHEVALLRYRWSRSSHMPPTSHHVMVAQPVRPVGPLYTKPPKSPVAPPWVSANPAVAMHALTIPPEQARSEPRVYAS